MTRLRITSADGTELAVHDHGNADAPTLVCVHGYPDDHRLWDGVVAELRDRFHVVTYDVRGAGESAVPRGRAAYKMDRLAEDLTAVIDAVSPGRPVHLLGHDWGSIQTWHFVTSDAAVSRVRSFTSISGPSLDLAGRWMRSGLRGRAGQLAHSWYILYFQLPLVPELSVRTGLFGRALRRTVGSDAPLPSGSTTDQENGLGLYRANMLQRLLFAPQQRSTDVPVQVLVAEDDAIVGAAVQTEAPRGSVRDLRASRIPGSHWVPISHPAVVAERTASFVDEVESR